MNLRRRPPPGPGYCPVAAPGCELQHLGLGLLRLAAGADYAAAADGVETALVLLSGSCDVTGPDYAFRNVGQRDSVFAGRATAVFVPSDSRYRVQALTALEAVAIQAPAPAGGQPRLIAPADVVVHRRGRPGFEREVHDIIDGRTPARRLVVGETFNAPGQWSSYPPHKHDEPIPGVEVRMEEVYYFRVSPPQGFALQAMYSQDGALDEAYICRDGDVTILPFGYHPVAAAPGYRVYYLWAMAGEGRDLVPHDDPAHAWVKDA